MDRTIPIFPAIEAPGAAFAIRHTDNFRSGPRECLKEIHFIIQTFFRQIFLPLHRELDSFILIEKEYICFGYHLKQQSGILFDIMLPRIESERKTVFFLE